VLVLSAVVILANQEDPDAPAVSIRHEAVTYHNGFSIYRMIVSARAPDGFGLFGIVISYDNSIIQPIHSSYFSDITAPTHTTVRPGSIYPFYTLVTGFIETPNAWLVRDGRTGFSFDVFTLGNGVTTDEMTDIFAFYYRAHANNIEAAPDAFRIEDGRKEDSMVGTDNQLSFVRSGIVLRNSLDITYVWGAASANPTYSIIPDWNVSGFYGEVLSYEDNYGESEYDSESYPEETPTPYPYETPYPNATSTPEPSPTPNPSSTPAPSAVPSATPAPSSTAPTPTPYSSTSPSPSPCPIGNRPNPATNPIGTGFAIFSAIVLIGIAFVGIVNVSMKHKAKIDSYNSAQTRHNREQRLDDFLDE